MLAFLRKRNVYAPPARAVYAMLLEKARQRAFYAEYGVPDTFTGRFDLLLLHVFLVMDRMVGEGASGRDFNQALFDATFADMDQTLRERGIGDMGVPKHMRKMMKAFNGRMHSYREALARGAGLEEALMRNLYAGAENRQGQARMADYIRRCSETLAKHSAVDVLAGRVVF